MHALYPDHKTSSVSSQQEANKGTGIVSSASSVSGFSILKERSNESLAHDSVLSSPETPAAFDTPRHRSVVNASPECLSTPGTDDPLLSLQTGAEPDEDCELRQACAEVLQYVNSDSSNGSCLPNVDAWATLDLQPVSLHSDASPSFAAAPTSGDETTRSMLLERDVSDAVAELHEPDYADIRRAVSALLLDQTFSERLSYNSPITGGRVAPLPTLPRTSSNPYRRCVRRQRSCDSNPFRTETIAPEEWFKVAKQKRATKTMHSNDSAASPSNMHADSYPTSLAKLLELAIDQYERQEDFVKALRYTSTLARVRHLSFGGKETQFPLVKHFIKDVRYCIRRYEMTIKKCESDATALELRMREKEELCRTMDRTLDALRTKMWYCTDVRSAAPFEELQRVVSAMRTMSLPTRPARINQPQLRHKSTLRPKAQNSTLKTSATIIEIMSAATGQGGPNKLSDGQVSLVIDWMQKQGIENICRGEERLHRVLCEISKVESQLVGADAVNSPVLWASELFQREREDGMTEAAKLEMAQADIRQDMSFLRPPSQGSESLYAARRDSMSAMSRHHSILNIGSVARFQSNASFDYLDPRSPSILSRSTTLWSSSGTGAQSPSSMTSLPSRAWSPKHLRQSISLDSFKSASNVKTLLSTLQQSVLSLMISDLSCSIFAAGSEIDNAMWMSFGGSFAANLSTRTVKAAMQVDTGANQKKTPSKGQKADKRISAPNASSQEAGSPRKDDARDDLSKSKARSLCVAFDHETACRKLLRRFDLQASPFAKLQVIHDLQVLILAVDTIACERKDESHQDLRTPTTARNQRKPDADTLAPLGRSRLRLETASVSPGRTSRRDMAVRGFRALFCDESMRPKRLFQDLQTIASLVSADVLDSSARGRAFWNATVAALSIKQEICQSMIETADRIIAFQTATRGHARGSSAAQRERDLASFASTTSLSTVQEDVSQYTMADAAQMLQITAKRR